MPVEAYRPPKRVLERQLLQWHLRLPIDWRLLHQRQ